MIARDRPGSYFGYDPSCKLYLPFYKYGGEQAKAWDQSGNNNHGAISGAVPGNRSIQFGSEEVSNGSFTSDTTGWTPVHCTLASVAGGQSGNCLEITRTEGTNQQARQAISFVLGTRYKVSFYAKSGTSGNESAYVQITKPGVGDTYTYNFTTTSAWVYRSFEFTADSNSTTLTLYKNSATAGTMLFDEVSVQRITGFESLGWRFDGVDDFITIENSASLAVGSEYTMIMWCIPVFSWTELIGKRNASSDDFFLQTVLQKIGGRYRNSSGSAVSLTSVNDFNLNQWNHIAFVKNGDVLNLYLNKVLEDSKACSGTPANTNNIFVGKILYTFSDVLVGEVSIFNRALSAQEVRNYFELTRYRYGV